MKVVSTLEVADPTTWDELAALVDLDAATASMPTPTLRVLTPEGERALLRSAGDRILVRYARRDPAEVDAERRQLAGVVAGLRSDVRKVLIRAQRHALDDVVLGRQAWDPEHDAPAVRALHGAGLITSLADEEDAPYTGRYRLHADLPPPPEVAYDFDDAVMPLTDDLSTPPFGPVTLLHDMASLAGAMTHLAVRVTHAGTVAKADGRTLGKRLAAADLAADGDLEGHVRWGRAKRGLDALRMITLDPLTRELHLDLGLESVLAGETEDATDRLVHRLVDHDLHVVVPALRAALRQAGDGAVDELIFMELLRDQHRDVLFPPWLRDGEAVYPGDANGHRVPYTDEAFDVVETRMLRGALARMERFGLIRRAQGVFASTPDGRRWADRSGLPHPPIWVTGDLELVVPPDSLTPWERFQVERLGRCLQRDVVDRYVLERASLVSWLATHDVDEALALLARRCPGVPRQVEETLRAWATSALQVVLTRGVLIDGDTGEPEQRALL